MDIREEVWAAFSDPEDRIGVLRKVAIDLSAKHPRETVRAAFASVCAELAESGREEDAAIVADVVDMLDEWNDAGKAWF